jgi:hypothetical protein
MSTLRTNNVQVGQSATATNNFTLYQPSVPDGTVRLGVGNTGATTLDAVTVTNAGNVGIGTTSPSTVLDVAASNSGITITNTGASNKKWRVGGGSAGQFQITETGIADRLTLDSSGNLQFNSGYGSVATAYGCRAWVNFNGTGTVAIRASGNVSSITDNGTGDYTVNFTTAMPDANYSLNMTIQRGDGAGVNPGYACIYGTAANAYTSLTSSSARIISANSATAALDMPYVGVSVFR